MLTADSALRLRASRLTTKDRGCLLASALLHQRLGGGKVRGMLISRTEESSTTGDRAQNGRYLAEIATFATFRAYSGELFHSMHSALVIALLAVCLEERVLPRYSALERTGESLEGPMRSLRCPSINTALRRGCVLHFDESKLCHWRGRSYTPSRCSQAMSFVPPATTIGFHGRCEKLARTPPQLWPKQIGAWWIIEFDIVDPVCLQEFLQATCRSYSCLLALEEDPHNVLDLA